MPKFAYEDAHQRLRQEFPSPDPLHYIHLENWRTKWIQFDIRECTSDPGRQFSNIQKQYKRELLKVIRWAAREHGCGH